MGLSQWRAYLSQRQKEWTHAGMQNRDATAVSYILYIPGLFAFFLITQHLQTFASPSCFPCLSVLPHCVVGVGSLSQYQTSGVLVSEVPSLPSLSSPAHLPLTLLSYLFLISINIY